MHNDHIKLVLDGYNQEKIKILEMIEAEDDVFRKTDLYSRLREIDKCIKELTDKLIP